MLPLQEADPSKPFKRKPPLQSCDDSGPLGGSAVWADALSLMRRALAPLDGTSCAADIGAHLDLAANRLELSMLKLAIGELGEPALLVELL